MPSVAELQAADVQLRNNPRGRFMRGSVGGGVCPACKALQGVYPKSDVPVLPAEGCSCPDGRPAVYYDPVLDEVYP